MHQVDWRRVLATGLVVVDLTFLFPWTSHVHYRGIGSGSLARPVLYFLSASQKEILWGEVALQAGAIMYATGALSVTSRKQ